MNPSAYDDKNRMLTMLSTQVMYFTWISNIRKVLETLDMVPGMFAELHYAYKGMEIAQAAIRSLDVIESTLTTREHAKLREVTGLRALANRLIGEYHGMQTEFLYPTTAHDHRYAAAITQIS